MLQRYGLLLLPGTTLAGWTLFWMYWAHRAKTWPTAEGFVDSFDRDPSDINGGKGLLLAGPTNPQIGYRYIVEGRQFFGSRYRFGPDKYYGSSESPRNYARGESIRVRYDPRRPSRCVLQTGIQSTAVLHLVFAAMLFVAGLLPFIE